MDQITRPASHGAADVAWACHPAARSSRGLLARAAARLTPYVAETIVEDALHAGPGARLELILRGDVATSLLGPLLARLARRGVVVNVRRGTPAAAA